MKHTHYLTFLLFLFAGTIQAQSYITSAGLRFGGGIGLTVQQRIAKKSTVEGILQSRLSGNEVRVTGLYERHVPIITKRLNLYGGIGLYKEWVEDTYLEQRADPIGVTFVGGAELTLGRVNLSLDIKPSIQVSQASSFNFDSQIGVSARYVLIKDGLFDKAGKKKKKKKKKKKDGSDWNIFKKD
ncbi:MAG: hypothetical protein KDC34_05390 [Saprospiraceae bacterium]|nr:hypothetical protein [Saprospiraceae bacterium]